MFEISEQESIRSFDVFREVRDEYGKLGFQFALDDTGAGYASLQSVIELEPDFIKVDRAFVQGIDQDPARQTLLRALRSVASGIGARIIGEGLDTLEELETLGRPRHPVRPGLAVRQAHPAPRAPLSQRTNRCNRGTLRFAAERVSYTRRAMDAPEISARYRRAAGHALLRASTSRPRRAAALRADQRRALEPHLSGERPGGQRGCCGGRRSGTCCRRRTTWRASTACWRRSRTPTCRWRGPLALCEDAEVNDAPFYVMEYRAGVVLNERVPEGFADDAEERGARISLALIDMLARLHAVDYRAVGLDDFGRPEGYLERQVRRWAQQWESSKIARRCPRSTS